MSNPSTSSTFKTVSGVLVEPRFLQNIHPLILNFKKVLPNTILYFFCGLNSYDFFKSMYENDNLVKLIPLDTDNLTAEKHNDLWKNIDFWNHFQTDYILTIQTDGCLCENSSFQLSEFLHYDYIGGYSPFKWWWKETNGLHDYSDYQCFNGGFSLRNVNAMKNVILSFPPLPTKGFTPELPFEAFGEDLYFVVGLLKLNQQNNTKNYNVALDTFATNFCTHTHYVSNTFCVHKLDSYVNKETLAQFLNYCPEFSSFIFKKY
jgi:hypothetical protein